MRFPLTFTLIVCLLCPNLLLANNDIQEFKKQLKSIPDSAKTELYLKISDKFKDINADSALVYANKALQNAIATKSIKSIIKTHIIVSYRFSTKGNYNESKFHLKQAEEIALKLKDPRELGKIYWRLGSHYSEISEYDKAIQYYNKSIHYCKISKDKRTIAINLNGLGIIYWERGDLELAVKKYLEAYDIADKLEDIPLKMNLMLNMANIYSDENQKDKALDNYQEILKMAKENNEKANLSAIYNNMAILYQDDEKYDEALLYFEKSLEIAKATGNRSNIALALNNIGENVFKTGKIKEAINYLNESLKINRLLHLDTEIIYNLETLAKIYLTSGKLQTAGKLIKEGLDLCNQLKLNSMRGRFLQLESEYYYSVGNYKQAYKTFEKFNSLKDSLRDINRSDKIAQLQTQFETEKKEKENELLRIKNQFTQEKLNKERTITNYLIVFFIITMSFLIVVYFLYKSKLQINQRIKKINGMLEESNQKLKIINATKDKFFSIIAHDLRSPFNAILGFSELIKDELVEGKDIEMIQEYNDNINESANSLFTLLENLLQWAKSQRGDLVFEPEQFDLHELIKGNLTIFKLRAMDKSIELSSDIKSKTMAYGDANMVNTIIRNLISNALKFTENNGKIEISATTQDNFVYLKVKDSGIGISKENQEKLFRLDCNYTTSGTNDEQGSGLGLILCKEFAEKNGGNIWVESQINQGSEFIFTLKSA